MAYYLVCLLALLVQYLCYRSPHPCNKTRTATLGNLPKLTLLASGSHIVTVSCRWYSHVLPQSSCFRHNRNILPHTFSVVQLGSLALYIHNLCRLTNRKRFFRVIIGKSMFQWSKMIGTFRWWKPFNLRCKWYYTEVRGHICLF